MLNASLGRERGRERGGIKRERERERGRLWRALQLKRFIRVL